ncbi:MAG TPA: phosphopantetheine-binding protein [Bryobacteraceae bacterium]|jgi:acyl carrier protein|nr:phosphopantetheine-binding protein [Bryobacteraceae bacterium]
MPNMTESEVFDKFAQIVAKSLRIDAAQIAPDTHLTDLGAESLDLIEITMETETQFHIFLPDKSILETAVEVFGPDILEKDGYLTGEGKRFLLCRMPQADAHSFEGDVAVKDLQSYFLKVGTWVRMIQDLAQYTPAECESCGGSMVASMGFRMKCAKCGHEITLRSGEELNREWVREYYDKEYRPQAGSPVSATAVQ